MEWTKPLSLVLAAFVVLLAVGSAVQLLGTTFTEGETVTASLVTMALVSVVVVVAIVVGARSRRWLQNPDSYW